MPLHGEPDSLIDATTVCNYTLTVNIVWDESKRLSNLKKHGVDFSEITSVFEGPTLFFLDDRFDYGEDRFVTIGASNGAVFTLVHTETANELRLISARKATQNEETKFFESIADELG